MRNLQSGLADGPSEAQDNLQRLDDLKHVQRVLPQKRKDMGQLDADRNGPQDQS